MMESIFQAIPLIAAAVAPLLVSFIRKRVEIVPDKYVPILLPVVGAAVGILASLAGYDLGNFNAVTADPAMWNSVVTGILSGLASNGVHQIGKQLKKPV